jgi:hypothetical protein
MAMDIDDRVAVSFCDRNPSIINEWQVFLGSKGLAISQEESRALVTASVILCIAFFKTDDLKSWREIAALERYCANNKHNHSECCIEMALLDRAIDKLSTEDHWYLPHIVEHITDCRISYNAVVVHVDSLSDRWRATKRALFCDLHSCGVRVSSIIREIAMSDL